MSVRRGSMLLALIAFLLMPAIVLYAFPGVEYDHFAYLPLIRTPLGEGIRTWAIAYGYEAGIRHGAGAVVESDDGGFVYGGTWDNTANILERDIVITKINASGNIIWQKRFDGLVDDQFIDLARSGDGKLIVAGSAIGEATKSRDAWFAKLDDDGSIIWQKFFDVESVGPWVTDIQPTSDGGFVAAGKEEYSDYDLWVTKFDGDGKVQWQKQYGNATVLSAAIEESSEGGYFVGGTWWSEDSNELDFHVLRLAADGKIIWQKAFGESGDESFMGLDSAEDGSLFVAGLTAMGAGWSDPRFWVMRINEDGDVEWHKELIGEWDMINAIRATPDGGCLVAGNTADGDMWLLKMNGDGSAAWQRFFHGTEWDEPADLLLASSGGYVLAGGTKSYGSGDSNAWLLRVDGAGYIDNCPIDEDGTPVLEEFSLPVLEPSITATAYTGVLSAGDLVSSDSIAQRTVVCGAAQANGSLVNEACQ